MTELMVFILRNTMALGAVLRVPVLVLVSPLNMVRVSPPVCLPTVEVLTTV